MSNNSKKRIDIYNTIYDIDIVVANRYTTLEDLKEEYSYGDEELPDSITECMATTTTVRNKKTKRFCLLVKYNKDSSDKSIDKHLDLINTAAHEAWHVLMDIYDSCRINISFDNQEDGAYFIGWITSCILKTWLNK